MTTTEERLKDHQVALERLTTVVQDALDLINMNRADSDQRGPQARGYDEKMADAQDTLELVQKLLIGEK